MDAIKLTLKEGADIAFLKKLFSSLKEISEVEILKEEDKTYSWEEIECSEAFGRVMEQSGQDYKKGKFVELDEAVVDDLFK